MRFHHAFKTGPAVFFLLLLSQTALSQSRFIAFMDGNQEVTTVTVDGASAPIINGGIATGAFGTAQFRILPGGGGIEYEFRASNFGTPLNQAHIHLGGSGVNGPVLVWLFNRAEDGDFTGQVSGFLTPADLIPRPLLGVETWEDLLANIRRGNTYINLHTEQFPAGEIRGQLERVGGVHSLR